MAIDGIQYNVIQKSAQNDKKESVERKAFTVKTSAGQITIWDDNDNGKIDNNEIERYAGGDVYRKLSAEERSFINSSEGKNFRDLTDENIVNGGNKTRKEIEKEERKKKSDQTKIRRELRNMRSSIEAQKKELANMKKMAAYQKNMQRQATSMAPFGMGLGMGMGMGMINPFFGMGGMLGGALGGGIFNSFMPQNTMEPDFSEMEAHINDQIDEYNDKLQQYGVTDEDVVKGSGDIQLEEKPQLKISRDNTLTAGDGTSAVTDTTEKEKPTANADSSTPTGGKTDSDTAVSIVINTAKGLDSRIKEAKDATTLDDLEKEAKKIFSEEGAKPFLESIQKRRAELTKTQPDNHPKEITLKDIQETEDVDYLVRNYRSTEKQEIKDAILKKLQTLNPDIYNDIKKETQT